MLSRAVFNIIKRSIYNNNNARMLYWARDHLESNFFLYDSSMKQCVMQDNSNLYVTKRFKSNKKKITDNKKYEDEDSDEEDKENEEEAPVGSKIFIGHVQSLRLDSISKVGFGMSRNKIEEAFYASKLRVNGKKVFKKSISVDVGDEIDLILHRHLDNPKCLIINRLVVLSVSPSTDNIRIKLSKEKNLLIEDYEESWEST